MFLKGMVALAAGAMLVLSCVACGEKQNKVSENDGLVDYEQSEDNRMSIIELSDVHIEKSETFGGHTYTYTIDRTPQDSVIVVDDEGYQTRDNSIRLSISRDGAPFFERTFHRSAFHIRVDENYYKQCVLLGMNFDRVTEYGLRFQASIGKGADGDSYKPYSVTIGTDGSTNITELDLYEDGDVNRVDDEEGV